MNDDRTIFALATGAGKAGISVFRISGTHARDALTKCCLPSIIPAARRAVRRDLVDPRSGDVVDRVLALYFPAPHSFTGEDIVELHAHGGRAVVNAIVASLQSLPHFRMAEPGEFTRRAFENNKMDLTEAEAIADLVHAETEAQRRQAFRQLEGILGQLYQNWRTRLKTHLAYMEAAIDFSDDDLPQATLDAQRGLLSELRAEIERHLDDNHRGERLREGFSVTILGPPNAGKSSLFNALARRDVAIVSPKAGTTRDVIDVHLDIGGYPIILADTAGLRPSSDDVETEGIRRAHQRGAQADLKLIVFDGSHWPRCDEETAALIDDDSLVVVNKSDLRAANDDRQPIAANLRSSALAAPPIFVSALTGDGLDFLLTKIGEVIETRVTQVGPPPLTRARHRTALQLCLENLNRSLNAPTADLSAEDLRLAMRALGQITGHVAVEDLLDVIFRDFCIGK